MILKSKLLAHLNPFKELLIKTFTIISLIKKLEILKKSVTLKHLRTTRKRLWDQLLEEIVKFLKMGKTMLRLLLCTKKGLLNLNSKKSNKFQEISEVARAMDIITTNVMIALVQIS